MALRRITIVLLLLAAAAAVAASTCDARAGDDEWKRLTEESLRLYDAGKYEEAIGISRKALDEAEAALGPRHPVTGKSMNNLGAMLAEHGDPGEAEAVLEKALSILEESLGKGHPGTSSALNNLAKLCEARGDDARAEELFLRALSIRRKAPGKDDADLVTTMENLAGLYAGIERFDDARALYGELLELEGASAASDLCSMLISEGNLRKKQGKPALAAAAYAEALETAERYGVDMQSGDGALQETIAALSVKARDLDGAARWYLKALERIPKAKEREGDRARIGRDLARVYMRMNRYGDAIPLYEDYIDSRRGRGGEGRDLASSAMELSSALSELARSYIDEERSGEAVPLMTRSLELRERYGARDDPSLAIRMNNLAGVLTGLSRFDEAERLYSRALEILGGSKGERDEDYSLVLGNLKRMYLLAGESAKAAAVDSLLGER